MLNKISRAVLEFILTIALIVSIGLLCITNAERNNDPYNFVDLQMRYKHYILVNKYQENDKDYVFSLVNPITKEEYKVYVSDYMYINVYFVGDTIK